MHDEEDGSAPAGMLRVVHLVAPWVALVAVVWAVFAAWGTFVRADKTPLSLGPSSEATSTASSPSTSTATNISGMEAVARKTLKLRALPNDTSEVLATAKEGDVLEIMSKDAGHLKVRDASGHVGWIPNDTEFITVRNKKK